MTRQSHFIYSPTRNTLTVRVSPRKQCVRIMLFARVILGQYGFFGRLRLGLTNVPQRGRGAAVGFGVGLGLRVAPGFGAAPGFATFFCLQITNLKSTTWVSNWPVSSFGALSKRILRGCVRL